MNKSEILSMSIGVLDELGISSKVNVTVWQMSRITVI